MSKKERISVEGKVLGDFPDLVRQIDREKHPEIDVNEIKAGSHKKFNWKCDDCGETFLQIVSLRTKGSGCPNKECVRKRRYPIYKINKERVVKQRKPRTHVAEKVLGDFPEIAIQLDRSKHPEIDVNEVKAGSREKFYWECDRCGESFLQSIDLRCATGSGCPNKECMKERILKTMKINKGWNPQKPKRIVGEERKIPEPSEDDIEEWKDVSPELQLSKYQISTFGRLRNKSTGYISKAKPEASGYIRFHVSRDDGTDKSILAHIIVAKTFVQNSENKLTVNHINKNPNDNRIVNLEHATQSDQNLKENRTTIKRINGTRSVIQYDLEGKFIRKWSNLMDIERELGIDGSSMYNVLKGIQQTAGGFLWEEDLEKYNSLEGEIWKECPLGDDYNKVEVSNMGRVRKIEGRIKTPTYGTLHRGYYTTEIYCKSEKDHKTFAVHRLVALAFLDNPENKPIVNHIDEDGTNNKLDNLEYATHSENTNHSKHKYTKK